MAKQKMERVKTEHHTVLPQNILCIGERVLEYKNIYIRQKVYKNIHKFTVNKHTNESGGVLVGKVIEELGKTNILIEGFIEAKYSEATPTTLTFTHNTWTYIHQELERNYKNMRVVGWIHTHPDFGIFLSENDQFIHKNFFSDQNQIAYVIDPIQKQEGFFFWINGSIEKCSGFYLFDKNGVKITAGDRNSHFSESKGNGISVLNLIMFTSLIVVNIILMASVVGISGKLSEVEKNLQSTQSKMVEMGQVINNQHNVMQQMVTTQQEAVKSLYTTPSPVPTQMHGGTEQKMLQPTPTSAVSNTPVPSKK